MALSFLTPSRCVLLIGDDALHIYNVMPGAVRLLAALPWHGDDFEETALRLIRKECRGKAILILNDMTDQHFKGGQRMPRVGVMDKMNVVKRKLQVAFPTYPIRGALAIKQSRKGAAADKTKGGGLYLFSAVPMSEPVDKTMSIAQKCMSSISGFYLLPIEGADMVQAVAKKLAGSKRKSARWVIFIGQHHGGALRQVITRDGQLAMTRMTPLAESDDADPTAWARDVSQEFRATISYLSRFGFSPEEGVDVVVVCGHEQGAAFEELIDIPCNYVSMTAPEVARALGIALGGQKNPNLADPLYVAWAGRKTRFTLPMKADELSRISMPRQVASLVIFLMVLGAGWQSWQVMENVEAMLSMRDESETQQQVLRTVTNEFDQEAERMKKMGFDVKLVQGAIGVFDALEKERMRPLPLMGSIGESLGGELRLDGLSLNYIPNLKPRDGNMFTGAEVVSQPGIEATLKLSFPPTVEPEMGVREVENLRRRLIATLPGYDVTIEKNVADYEYVDSITGTAGKSAKELASEDRIAVIRIKGAVE